MQSIEQGINDVDDEIRYAASQLTDLIAAKESNSDIDGILKWLEEKRKNSPILVSEIAINELEKWAVDPKTGNISHESGKFYSIIGVKVHGAKEREVAAWTQPVIKQNECGILGILTKKIKGIRHYLLQAKFEPGNMHLLQLSPTLQATASNLKQAHQGKKPLLAEYFENLDKVRVLTSVESVEDGGRFFLKSNQNMIVEVSEEEQINVPDNFIWVNLYQLKKLMKKDLVANSLTRSVLGSI